jgi:hypothetical protein
MMFLLGGRCFALLAPRSLRPSGHLRCASSPPPGGLVVSAVVLRESRRGFDRMDGGRRGLQKSDDTEVVPPGGRCFALLAPRSLRPSGHLRCASSPPPGGLVVSAVVLRESRRGLVGWMRAGAACESRTTPGGRCSVSAVIWAHRRGGLVVSTVDLRAQRGFVGWVGAGGACESRTTRRSSLQSAACYFIASQPQAPPPLWTD